MLDCLAQSSTGIIPAWLQDIYFLYAGKQWDLKRKERMLICKYFKDCLNAGCTPNPVNYFSSSLSSSDDHPLVPHFLSKVFMWFLCALIVSLPAAPVFIKHAILSWRTDFPFDSILAGNFQSGFSFPLCHTTLTQVITVFSYFSMLLPSLSWLSLILHLCPSPFMNLFFLHPCTLSTVLAAAASENVCNAGNFEMFSFVY